MQQYWLTQYIAILGLHWWICHTKIHQFTEGDFFGGGRGVDCHINLQSPQWSCSPTVEVKSSNECPSI